MQKLKPSETAIMNDRTKSIVGYCMFKNGMNHSDWARVIGVSQSTNYNRLHNPQSYTLGELRAICKRFKLTKEQIVELIGVTYEESR